MEYSYFFNAVQRQDGSYDREYDTIDFVNYFSDFIGNGLFFGNNFMNISVTGNMQLTIKPGKAFINGHRYVNDGNIVFDIPLGNTSVRTDSIVIRVDHVIRMIRAKYNVGTPNNETPYPIRDANTYDLMLYRINVPVDAVKISETQICDTRLDASLCGVVSAILNQADATEVYNQFHAWMKEKQVSWTAQWNDSIQSKEISFITWFDRMKGQLSTDAAGNLELNKADKNMINVEDDAITLKKLAPNARKRNNFEESMRGGLL